ncbi:Ubiquitin-associated protein 2 [Saguinus oedipus]|uniref:Ubiquitin-associated protein 2 n=1 Tax=Saguinus oedipus TaxID=9490 RepID=A0ABQ9WF23_SAGOE|nr:Ubiquitin-associated protein 2 [Saguinus oedipus]
MRLAQVIFDKNDSDFEAKVKQLLVSPEISVLDFGLVIKYLYWWASEGVECVHPPYNTLMEVTGKNQDECIVALHDCNGDVNKAINILLEGNSDTDIATPEFLQTHFTSSKIQQRLPEILLEILHNYLTSWETVGGKKKNFTKENSENKENRDKKSEKESIRGRGNNNRKGRGGNRGREFRGEENGIDSNQVDKPSDRGKRARGRGSVFEKEGCLQLRSAPDLDVAEGEGQEGSQPKAWGHLILRTIQILHLQIIYTPIYKYNSE